MVKPTGPSRTYHVPAMEKGLDVLEALAFSSVPLSLAELARRLGRTSSELFRTLSALEDRDYVQRDPLSGKYRLTLKLFALGHSHSPVDKLVRAATFPMRLLTEQIRESCHLSILDHCHLMVIAQAESHEKIRFSVEVGAASSPLHTASGRLLLAYLGEKEFEDFCAANSDYRFLPTRQKKILRARLAAIRRHGYSIAKDETTIGVHDVSVLVGNPRAGLTAALAVAFLASRGELDKSHKVLTAARKCAAAITQALGLHL